jgi:hypothetical protein
MGVKLERFEAFGDEACCWWWLKAGRTFAADLVAENAVG